MAINADLLVDGKILTEDELAAILNPLTQEELNKYVEPMSLTGLCNDIADYLQKFTSYVETGNTNKYDSKIEIVKEEITVTLYKMYIKQPDGTYFEASVFPTDPDAIAYDYTYTVDKFVYKNSELGNIINEFKKGNTDLMSQYFYVWIDYYDTITNWELKGLTYCCLDNFVKDISILKEFFVDIPTLTARIILELLKDILSNIDDLRQYNKENYINEKYLSSTEVNNMLYKLKRMYIHYFEEYEKSCNWMMPGYRKTNGDELDWYL